MEGTLRSWECAAATNMSAMARKDRHEGRLVFSMQKVASLMRLSFMSTMTRIFFEDTTPKVREARQLPEPYFLSSEERDFSLLHRRAEAWRSARRWTSLCRRRAPGDAEEKDCLILRMRSAFQRVLERVDKILLEMARNCSGEWGDGPKGQIPEGMMAPVVLKPRRRSMQTR